MDRVEFVHSIVSKDDSISYAEMIVRSFEQYMLLYNLLDTSSITSIVVLPVNNSIIQFMIVFNDNQAAKTYFNKLANTVESGIIMTIYEKQFKVDYSYRLDTTEHVIITMIKM